MKHPSLYILLSQLVSVHLAYASTVGPLPAELKYLNQPIDSLCFFMSEKVTDSVDLKKCGSNKNKVTIKPINAELSQKGYLGYNYKEKSATPGSQGYSYYKVYPAGNNNYWVYSINNSGGTGQFSAISLVERKTENTLGLTNIAGGDRCNGGIDEVSEKSNALTYGVNLTAFDLIDLADKKTTIKPYDDLAACAVCCVAQSFYTVQKNTKPILDYVELNTVSDVSEMPEQGSMQACFNQFYVSYTKKNSTKLTEEQLLAFINQFKQTCVK